MNLTMTMIESLEDKILMDIEKLKTASEIQGLENTDALILKTLQIKENLILLNALKGM